jgi:hypothetical protein
MHDEHYEREQDERVSITNKEHEEAELEYEEV